MLSSLSLSNFALFKKQTIEFENHFNCLLGQSGAGKSVVMNALAFVLGAKADKSLIRSNEQSCRVDAVFCNLTDEVQYILKENDIDIESELIISRTLSVDGRSSIKINGFPTSAKVLQVLAEKLVDFCGQHESVGLLNVANHLLLLDRFAGKEIEKQKDCVCDLFDKLKDIEKKISGLGGDDIQREREKELLQFQIEEIENANLDLTEEETLKERFAFISSAENIYEKVTSALEKLDGQRENISGLLFEAKNELSGLSQFSDIDACRERLENAYYEVKDIADVLEQIRQNTEFDPKELERIDARLDLIKSLSKKYGKTVEDILDYLAKCQERLQQLENSQQLLEELSKQAKETENLLAAECEKLSDMRKKAAKDFSAKICAQLEDLQMQGARFDVVFEKSAITRKGFDSVKFVFSANKGQELKDLNKTASGGELSRLLLAFRNVMLDKEKVQTVVFDEIDAGISGITAGKVAEKLVNISKHAQIICITHTSVVASKADNFVLIEKKVENDNTVSVASTIDKDQSVVEVARLIDGAKEVSSTAISHAKKLFENK